MAVDFEGEVASFSYPPGFRRLIVDKAWPAA
jgi:hypothetical protein